MNLPIIFRFFPLIFRFEEFCAEEKSVALKIVSESAHFQNGIVSFWREDDFDVKR